MVDIATRIIDQNVGPFEPEAFVDRYHDAVRKLIEARRKGVKPVSAPAPRAEQRRRSDGSLEEEPSLRRWRQAARP